MLAGPMPPNGMLSIKRLIFTRFTAPPPYERLPMSRSMWSCRVLKMKAARGAGLSAILARASSKSVYVRIGRMGPSVDPADHLMAGYTRPGDREHAGDRPSVAMTDPTSLDTDADIAGRWFVQRLCREFKLSRRD